MPKINKNEQLRHDDLGQSDTTGGQQSVTTQYAVGYCRPPLETRFKKGQSGSRGVADAPIRRPGSPS